MNLNFIKGLKSVSENRTDTPFLCPERVLSESRLMEQKMKGVE